MVRKYGLIQAVLHPPDRFGFETRFFRFDPALGVLLEGNRRVLLPGTKFGRLLF